MSSDSDEDIGLRLQKMTNKYQGDKIESTALLNDSNEIDDIFKKYAKNERESSPLDLDELPGPSVTKTPDKVLEFEVNKRPKRVTRSSARKRNSDETLTEGLSPSVGKRSKKSTATANSSNKQASDSANDSSNTNNTDTPVRGRGRGRGRGKRKSKQQTTTDNNNTSTSIVSSYTSTSNVSDLNLNTSSSRGRAANEPSGGQSNSRNRRRWQRMPSSPLRGRGNLRAMAQVMAAMMPTYDGHIYAIGDAEDVADSSRGQALFSNQKKAEEVVDIEENDEHNGSLDDNEELSVKVHWQSYKYEIFKIRRYQKLTQIFDYFAEKENVRYNKLLFMYNDKIIKSTDTPDSINYNIAKKIEGGTLENSVAPLASNDEEIKDGIQIKFQCQHLKKPFEFAVRLDDKFSVAMTKCAEHIEKPVNMLQFEFDGDIVSAKSTARELELEGGECIDVKVAR